MSLKITKNYITSKNRPKINRKKTTKLAVHYVANPGSSAIANRNYFQNTSVDVSSNYIVGLEGEIICCIPHGEIAWCTNKANDYSVSIETCHPKSDGKFGDQTYESLVKLCSYILDMYKLTSEDLIRHFDVTGKVCPKCFVAKSKGGTDDENLTAWKKFKNDVKKEMEKSDEKLTDAPSTSETPAETATSGTYYTVKKGDALSIIAKKFKTTVENLVKLNDIKNPDLIYSGQKLKVKKGGSTPVSGDSKPAEKPVKVFSMKDKITLKNADLFVSATTKTKAGKKSGTYYIYDNTVSNKRMRITNKKSSCGKSPVGLYVTGWVSKSDFK